MRGILKSIKDSLKQSLGKVLDKFKRAWQAFSNIFKRPSSILDNLESSIQAIRQNPKSLQEVASSLEEKLEDMEGSQINIDFSSRLDILAKQYPQAQYPEARQILDEVAKIGKDRRNRAIFLASCREFLGGIIIDAPSDFNGRQRRSLFGLLVDLSSSIEAIIKTPDSLYNQGSSLEEKIEKERDPKVRLEFLSKLSALADKNPEARKIINYLDDRTQAKNLSSEFLEKNSRMHYNGEQREDLQELFNNFSDCIKHLYQPWQKLYLDVLKGMMKMQDPKVLLEFSSRVNEFMVLHPEVCPIVDDIEPTMREAMSKKPASQANTTTQAVSEYISLLLKPNPASLSEPRSELASQARNRGNKSF